ncbi:MAG: 30S ribosomal protein S20 [Nitrospinota bacterium]|nr:30S ribosomal protein S20 [Nitrospinota bacterium]
MPNHKSAIKRVRQNETKRMRNMAIRTRARTAVKKVRAAIDAKDKESATKLMLEVSSLLDGSVSKGVAHANNAARKISRLTLQINKLP